MHQDLEHRVTQSELEHHIVTLAHKGHSRRAIARALGISRNTVRKMLEGQAHARAAVHSALPAPRSAPPRPQKLDEYVEQMTALLTRYPNITTRRIFEELRDSGFDGGYTAVKVRVRRMRPKPAPKPSLETPVSGPGEMAESDWSPFMIAFTAAPRVVVQVFNYVLRFSHRKSYRLFERCDFYALTEGHVQTFNRFGGAAHVCKYDSQKAVVLGWEGQQPIYNPRFLAFATYYEFRPEACRRFHPNDKPRTERSFWEFETSFLNGRSFRDLADMREQLALWLDRTCDVRPSDRTKQTPLQVFAQERTALRALPAHPYDTARVCYRVASIDGFVSVEGSRYAVPYDHVTDILPVRVTQNEVFVYAADLKLVARYELAPRGAGRDVVAQGMHVLANSRRGVADMDQLRKAYDDIGEDGALFFAGLASAHPRHCGYHARQILVLRERFATADLGAALRHARAFGAFEQKAVERILSARAAPRTLAEYVDDDLARRLEQSLEPRDVLPRDLDEYDRLPVITRAKEPSCPQEDPHPSTTSCPSGSDEPPKSSD
jgi:transposase